MTAEQIAARVAAIKTARQRRALRKLADELRKLRGVARRDVPPEGAKIIQLGSFRQ
jgi:hypothetical protein